MAENLLTTWPGLIAVLLRGSLFFAPQVIGLI